MSNFFIGIITGLISGWIVASYYRSKEKEEQWLKELFFDKQNLSRFAELLSLELDILRSELKNGVEPMQEEINNILKNIIKRPQFPSFDEKRLPQWAQEIALNYNEVFNDVESYFKNGIVEERDLLNFRYRLNKARFQVLLISTGKYDLRNEAPFLKASLDWVQIFL